MGNVLFDNIPDLFKADTQVTVNYNIAKSADIPPIYVGMSRFERIG